jgi:peptidoglycan hydrolase-like protein with peptidoglycan-binding domain
MGGRSGRLGGLGAVRRPRSAALAGAGAALLALAGCATGGAAATPARSGPATPARAVATHGPLRVRSIRPGTAAGAVAGTTSVVVTYSIPPAAGAARPRISPAVPGRWTTSGATVTFHPDGAFPPFARVTVTVPAGTRAGDGAVLPRSVRGGFRVGGGSTAGLQQLLATLGYLPVRFSPDTPVPRTAAAEALVAFRPPAGHYRWRSGSWPATLRRLWHPGRPGVLTKGAVMAFEASHGLARDGIAGPQVWSALLRVAVAGRADPQPYDYAVASERSPETLTIWRDGRRVFHSLANTGIPQAPTATGTYPVYERLRRQVMRGRFDGQRYADPVQFVAYFHGGDAVHYIARTSYGYPQSLGCVELPLRAAARAWPLLGYGTLVTVAG